MSSMTERHFFPSQHSPCEASSDIRNCTIRDDGFVVLNWQALFGTLAFFSFFGCLLKNCLGESSSDPTATMA